MVQEKKRSEYPGWNTGDVIAFVDLFRERNLWTLTGRVHEFKIGYSLATLQERESRDLGAQGNGPD